MFVSNRTSSSSNLLMQASGVGVNDEVVTKYNELQKGHKFRYVLYRLSDDLEEASDSSAPRAFMNPDNGG